MSNLQLDERRSHLVGIFNVHGTTILVFIGQGKIYVVSDGRASGITSSGLIIIGGDEIKVTKLQEFTVCSGGHEPSINWVIDVVDQVLDIKKFSGRFTPRNRLSCIQGALIRLKQKWKEKQPHNPFPCDMFFIGTLNGRRTVFEFNENFHMMHDDMNRILCIGCSVAQERCEARVGPGFAMEDAAILQDLKKSVAFAALSDPYTGGFLTAGVCGSTGYHASILQGCHKEHVLSTIKGMYHLFEEFLHSRLFVVTEMWRYTIRNENIIKQFLESFGLGEFKVVILGIASPAHSKTVIIRSLEFPSSEAAISSFEKLTGDPLMFPVMGLEGVRGVQGMLKYPKKQKFNIKCYVPSLEVMNHFEDMYTFEY